MTEVERVEVACDIYNSIRCSLLITLAINAIISLIIFIIVVADKEHVHNSYYVGFALEIIAAVVGIVGAWQEDFWLVGICDLLEFVSFVLFIVNREYTSIIMSIFVLVLASVLLVLMAQKGKHLQAPFCCRSQKKDRSTQQVV